MMIIIVSRECVYVQCQFECSFFFVTFFYAFSQNYHHLSVVCMMSVGCCSSSWFNEEEEVGIIKQNVKKNSQHMDPIIIILYLFGYMVNKPEFFFGVVVVVKQKNIIIHLHKSIGAYIQSVVNLVSQLVSYHHHHGLQEKMNVQSMNMCVYCHFFGHLCYLATYLLT